MSLIGRRWEFRQGDRPVWRPTLDDLTEEIPPLPAGSRVWLIVTNTVGTAGNFTREIDVIDFDTAQIEWEPTPDEADTIGVFRMTVRVIIDPGGPGERQLTFPNDEAVALVIGSP